MKEKKKVLIVVASILALIVAFNIAWFANYSLGYNKYIEPLEEVAGENMLFKDGYTYSVKRPFYLSFTGNLAMTASNQEALMMWPKLLAEDEYGITITIESGRFDLLLDKNLNLIGKTNDRNAQKVLDENRDKIEKLYEQARLVWDI